MPTTPQVGDRVAVPWGLDTVEGVVVATYRTGAVDRLVIEVKAPGTAAEGEATTIVLPANEVAGIGDLRHGGDWLHGYRYEREVAAAITRVINEWQPSSNVTQEGADLRADITADTPFGTLIVEVKRMDQIPEHAVRQLQNFVSKATDRRAKGLLVVDGTLSESLRRKLADKGLLSPDLGVVRWRGPKDDKRLSTVIQALFSPKANE